VLKSQKSVLQYQLCRNLFSAGEYAGAVTSLESLITGPKPSDSTRIQKAMMLQGHCLAQLGEFERATQLFAAAASKYPDEKETAQASFMIGYSYMLQKNFDRARQTLNQVVKKYPASSYAGKAELCLLQMEQTVK